MPKRQENVSVYWLVYVLFIYVLWGTQHPFLKILSSELSPYMLNFLRFGISALVLAPFVLRERRRISRGDLLKIFLLGLVGIFIYGILNVMGVHLSTSTNNAILLNSWPLMLAILAPFLINEEITKKSVLGLVIGFVGVLLVITNGDVSTLLSSQYLAGNALILASGLCMAFYSMYNKPFIKKYGGLQVTFYAVIAGTAFLLASTIATSGLSIPAISLNSWLMILWVAIPTTALAWVVWFKSIDKIGLVKTSSFFLLIPVSGIITSSLILHEQITAFTLIGAALILAGIYFVHQKIPAAS